MYNRWCIISGPRSGSTWIEKSIYNALVIEDQSAQRLQEIINPGVGLINTFRLLPNKKIEFIENKRNFLSDKDQLLTFIKTIIIHGDNDQALTCRVFPQNNFFSVDEYMNFFKILLNNNFHFINLERNLFDRAISFYMALETNLWHRVKTAQNQINLTSSPGKNPTVLIEPLSVNIPRFIENYKYLKKDAEIRKYIFTHLPCMNISYENLNEDIQKSMIPFLVDDTFLKTYDQTYQKMIKNYDELLESIKDI